jgi:hypothetical protein
MKVRILQRGIWIVMGCCLMLFCGVAIGQVIPGTGLVIVQAGDDFEDPAWTFNHNFPKSSQNLDGNARTPQGVSANGRWEEGLTRGQPDILERVATPTGGLSGSTHCLRVRSQNSGVPGSPSGNPQQDDLIGRIVQISGVGVIPVSRQPSLIARIRIPPPEQWENTVLSALSFRVGVEGTNGLKNWPGMFFQLNRAARTVTLIGRANELNQDFFLTAAFSYDEFLAPRNGWMTVGLSFTNDGRMHYYAGLGAGSLGAANLLNSRFPGNQPVKQLEYFFSSTVNTDNGSTWSPEFHLDDVRLTVNDGTPVVVPKVRGPALQSGIFSVQLEGLTVGGTYRAEQSTDLVTWQFVERFLASQASKPWQRALPQTPERIFFRFRPES